jgi:phosphatidylinositol 3-kinase
MLSVIFTANDIYAKGVAKHKCVDIRKCAIEVLDKQDTESIQKIMLQLVQAYRYEDFKEGLLKNFFLSKVTQNQSIAQTFYWQVRLEKDNEENFEEIREMFTDLYDEFMNKLEEDNPECKKLLDDQWKFREKLYALSNYVKQVDKVEAKKARLREAVSEGGKFDMMNFEPAPMPLDPSVKVCGIVPEKCSIFTSAL